MVGRIVGMSVLAVSIGALGACQKPSPLNPSVSPTGTPLGTGGGPGALFAPAGQGGNGNGAPTGNHFTLNVIGVPQDKTADIANGSRIFVSLDGHTTIDLQQGDFAVIDGNGTDGTAIFQLPNPDTNGDGTSSYSVFARALGQPGGSSSTQTCFNDGSDTYCSEITLTLSREKNKSTFQNVTKYLLYIYYTDGTAKRTSLFADSNADYWWSYDNNGLRLAQFRFYPCSTTVPAAGDSGGTQYTACFD